MRMCKKEEGLELAQENGFEVGDIRVGWYMNFPDLSMVQLLGENAYEAGTLR